jgi:hypothetical protein
MMSVMAPLPMRAMVPVAIMAIVVISVPAMVALALVVVASVIMAPRVVVRRGKSGGGDKSGRQYCGGNAL